MPLPRESPQDEQLIRHLLGALPDEEAQRIEEVCLLDDEAALRLEVLEGELVDAYTRGALTGDRLARFESFYLASPRRRAKVAFARRFVAAVDKAASLERRPAAAVVPDRPKPPRRWVPWTLAAAAALFVSTGGLLVRDVRLHRAVTDAERRVTVAERRAGVVSGHVTDEQQAAATATRARAAQPAEPAEPVAPNALLLVPQTRGVDPVPVLAVPPAATALPLRLKIETAGGAQYSVSLRDPGTNGIVWRSPTLGSERARRPWVVPVRIPAAVLKPQHYALDLYEVRAGTAEFAGSYAFEIVRP